MNKDEFLKIVDRYLDGRASELDMEFLSNYCDSFQQHDAWDNNVEGSKRLYLQALYNELHQETGRSESRSLLRFLGQRWRRIAACLLLISGAAYLYYSQSDKKASSVRIDMAESVHPGADGAILTLDDGSKLLLDSLKNGIVTTQNGTVVVLKNGQLAYNPKGTGNAGGIAYNTITTPNGRQFSLVLPDGSIVWLNSGSSIRYPTAFTGNERKVEMTGEAYFEVAGNVKQPFHVNVDGKAMIDVLGTHFNVNAYNNEPAINTTLFEGGVRASLAGSSVSAAGSVVLNPGQQAQMLYYNGSENDSLDQPASIKIIRNVDLDKIIAWKNGLFNFNGMTLEEVMRQLSRWYDIDIKVEGSASKRILEGEMYRSLDFPDVLAEFKKMGINNKWEDKTLTVY